MNNVYFDPEAFGLTQVAELEFSSGSYEFDTRVVWRDQNGVFYTARDSGCSCPTPFDDYKGIPELDRAKYDDLEREAKEGMNDRWSPVAPAAVDAFLAALKQAGVHRQ